MAARLCVTAMCENGAESLNKVALTSMMRVIREKICRDGRHCQTIGSSGLWKVQVYNFRIVSRLSSNFKVSSLCHYNCETRLQKNLCTVSTETAVNHNSQRMGTALGFLQRYHEEGGVSLTRLWQVMRHGCSNKMSRQKKNNPISGCIACFQADQ